MLTASQPRRRPSRRQRSLRQEYEEFLLERIEEFKQQISREELLAIADEAVHELEVDTREQLVLTEVLVLEHVDRLISNRLNLPSFRRWKDKHRKLRRAQQEPTHWGLGSDTPLAGLAEELEGEGDALVVGAAAAPAAYFLSAHEWPVVFIDPELTVVESVETRAAAEALASRFHALVVGLGTWFPAVHPALTVLDPLTLSRLDAPARAKFLDTLTAATRRGGVHCVLPAHQSPNELTLGPETLTSHYTGWHVERGRSGAGVRWILAVKS